MDKVAYCLSGIGDTGKSTTIRLIYELLKKRNKLDILIEKMGKRDIYAIICINGIKIGIESQGDPGSRMKESLIEFEKQECIIIVCASRSYGKTYDIINTLEPRYKIIRYKTEISNEINLTNTKLADNIYNEIETETKIRIKLLKLTRPATA